MEPTFSGNITTNTLNGKDSPHINEVYFMSAILALFAVIGTTGNAIVIYVFYRQKDNSVSTFFILTLACIDFGICLFNIPYVIFTENISDKISSDFICKTSIFLYKINIPFSAFVIVAIAIDRYFAICHPFKRVMTVPRAKFLVVCMAAIAFAMAICHSLEVGVYDYEAKGRGYLEDGETFGSAKGKKQSTQGIYQSEIDVSSSGIDVKHSTDPTETLHAERRNIINTGYCRRNELIFSWKFQWALHGFRSVLYLFCFVVILVLYILIYQSVLHQRKIHRLLQMEAHLALAQTSIAANRHSNWTSRVEMPLASCASTTSPDDHVLDSPSLNAHPHGIGEYSSALPTESAAATMLFVVTIVFALSFLPTTLMQYHLIPFNLTVLYMFFVNNVANPIIYSFMNRNFRENVKNLIFRR